MFVSLKITACILYIYKLLYCIYSCNNYYQLGEAFIDSVDGISPHVFF